MDPVPPLHAAHEVRDAFSALGIASWATVGLGVGALVLVWGRIVAWLRSADAARPALLRWGVDSGEAYFELRAPFEGDWSVELAGGELRQAVRVQPRELRAPLAEDERPVALVSNGGVRLLL